MALERECRLLNNIRIEQGNTQMHPVWMTVDAHVSNGGAHCHWIESIREVERLQCFMHFPIQINKSSSEMNEHGNCWSCDAVYYLDKQ